MLRGIVNLIFSLAEFSPLQPISRGLSGMYEREKREEPPLSRLFSVIISTIWFCQNSNTILAQRSYF